MTKDDRRLEGAAAFVSVSCGMDSANRSQTRTSPEEKAEENVVRLVSIMLIEYNMPCASIICFNVHMLSCFGCASLSQDTGLYYDRYPQRGD